MRAHSISCRWMQPPGRSLALCPPTGVTPTCLFDQSVAVASHRLEQRARVLIRTVAIAEQGHDLPQTHPMYTDVAPRVGGRDERRHAAFHAPCRGAVSPGYRPEWGGSICDLSRDRAAGPRAPRLDVVPQTRR
jgi:hypothetical protein